MERPVLICFDGSDHAVNAIKLAAETLGPRKAIVLHVWNSGLSSVIAMSGPELVPVVDAEAIEESSRERSDRITNEGVELARAAGFDAEGLSIESNDDVWPAVIQTADEKDACPIVAGSRGSSTAKAMLIGSVSNAILHHTARPVLIVPPAKKTR